MSRKASAKEETKISNALNEIIGVLKTEKEDMSTHDKRIIELFQRIFVDDSNKVKFPEIDRLKEKNKFNYIIHFIKLYSSIFKLTNKERNELYCVDIKQIKDKQINDELQAIKYKHKIEIKSKMPNYKELYGIIVQFIIREEYTLIQYMDTLIFKMAYVLDKMNVLRFCFFLYIDEIYIQEVLKNKTQIFDFIDCQMDLTNRLCITLIKNLFDKNNLKGEAFILSLMIFRFNDIKDIIENYDISTIKDVVYKVNNKLLTTFDFNDSLFVETILLIIEEEIENIGNNKDEIQNIESNINNNNKHIEITKDIFQNNENVLINDINSISNNSLDNSKKNPQNEDKKISVKENINNIVSSQENINNNIIIKNIEKDNIGDKKININGLCNKILNMKEVNKDELNLKDIQDSIKYLICKINKIEEDNGKLKYDNGKLKDDYGKLKDDYERVKDDNEKIKERLKDIENDVKILKNQNYEIKAVLSDIQFRKQSKNFLKIFKSYLTNDDIAIIKDNLDKRGTVISERIKKEFSKKCDNKKLNLMQNLIIKAADLLNRGNNSAHSLSISYYKEKIEVYKKEKNIRFLDDIKIFCFLVGIKLEKPLFDETYAFLVKYFQSDLEGKSWRKGYIENILK